MSTHHGEYKVPGGKLVVVDLEEDDGAFTDLSFSGDFFLEPEEALTDLNQALRGLPVNLDVLNLTRTLSRALAPATLVGFSARDAAIAVRRAAGGAVGWSDLEFSILGPQVLSPEINLALDQVLLDEVGTGKRGPLLRWWDWDTTCVVIGSFQSVRNEVDMQAAQAQDVRVVRRISGGGAMYMEPGSSVTFSLYVPASLVEGLSFEESYAFLDTWVVEGLRQLGVNANYAPLNDIASPAGKIGGAAQKRTSTGAVLHHVTMAYDMDAAAMTRVLRIGREKLSDKGTTSANKRVDPLRTQTGLSRDEVIGSLDAFFRGRYGGQDGELSGAELGAAQTLVEQKFSTNEWLYRVR